MTKEECIGLLNRYAEYDGMGIPHLAGCREAMRTAVELLQQPSLPPNLDEAAKEEADELLADMKIDGDMIYLSTAKVLMIALARFGAEWMAGQGQTFEAHVDNGCAIASGVKLPFVLWDAYEDGDVLKVQIRKK